MSPVWSSLTAVSAEVTPLMTTVPSLVELPPSARSPAALKKTIVGVEGAEAAPVSVPTVWLVSEPLPATTVYVFEPIATATPVKE